MMNIYVGNLSFKTTEDELRKAFEEFGGLSSCSLIIDRATGQSKGFAFVEMDDDTEANAAIQALNDTDLGGRNIKVNQAKPRAERPQRDRRW